MTEFVRVKADNGQEISVPATYAASAGFKALEKPAVDRFGRPLPVKSPLNLRRSTPASAPAEAPSRKGASKENQ